MVTVLMFIGFPNILITGTLALTVSSPGKVFGLLDKNTAELVCTYTVDAGDKAIFIEWQRRVSGSSTYQAIALFDPAGSPTVSTSAEGQAVNGRVNLTNPTAGSLTAKVLFTQIQCSDERRYRCQVSYRNIFGQISKESSTNLVLIAKPTAPNTVVVEPKVSSVEENGSIKFTCSGNIGKPAGKYKWTKYRGNTVFPITPSVTTTTTVPNDCTFTGVSTITLTMTKEDNEAAIRCTVDTHDALSPSEAESLYQQTDNITVYYQPRTPTIIKNPDHAIYYAGESTLTLTCVSDGNPAPTYTWLLPTRQLVFSPIDVNQAGEYSCIAENSYNNKSFQATSKVGIKIYPPTTAVSSTPLVIGSTEIDDSTSTSMKCTKSGVCDKAGWIAAFAVAVVINVLMGVVFIMIIHRSRTRNAPSGTKFGASNEAVKTGDEYETPMDFVPIPDTYEQLQHTTRSPESQYTALQS